MKNKLKLIALIFVVVTIIVAITGYIYRKQIVAHFVPTVKQIGGYL